MSLARKRFADHRLFIHAVTVAAILLGGTDVCAQVRKAAAPKFDAASALNKAIRQPMLAERITKSFTLVGQKVLETRSRRQMDDATNEFSTALKELQASAPTPEIKENYQLLEQLFDEFKSIVGKPANTENAKLLAEQNEELVWISTKGATLIQAHTKSARSDLIVTAGDVRTLTQRIAKLYLFRSWGLRSDVIANDLKKAEADYRADMAKLLAARVAWSNADASLQIHGGNGYAMEFEISRVLCDARILNIFEGAAEIQAQVVGRGLLARGQH